MIKLFYSLWKNFFKQSCKPKKVTPKAVRSEKKAAPTGTSEKVCPVCGKKFQRTLERRKYCSDECRSEAYRAIRRKRYHEKAGTSEKVCPVCGKKFQRTLERRKYCSDECRKIGTARKNAEYNARYKHKLPPKICPVCQKTFHPNSAAQVCCSKACSHFYRNSGLAQKKSSPITKLTQKKIFPLGLETVTAVCSNCGKTFQKPLNSERRLCSKECREQVADRMQFVGFRRNGFKRKSSQSGKKSIEQWQAEAAQCGMSYGVYRANIEKFGKTFEELKLPS